MNMNMISAYLQFLRKSHDYTQDSLAEKLHISRQAVSKWETGATLPDLEILLRLSRLYGVTINDMLEPEIPPRRIGDFEQIPAVPENEVKELLKSFDAASLAIALMGASPETNHFFERVFDGIDFEAERKRSGPVRVETVEDMQRQMVAMINLQAGALRYME